MDIFVAQPEVTREVAKAIAVGCPVVVPGCVDDEALLECNLAVDRVDHLGTIQSGDVYVESYVIRYIG